MTMKRGTVIGLLVAGWALAGSVYVADKLISRSDRIDFERQRAALVHVRDALLRHEYREGRLPVALDEMIPVYINALHLYDGDTARYSYCQDTRRIDMADRFRIRGLVSRWREPEGFTLPVPEPEFAIAAEAPVDHLPHASAEPETIRSDSLPTHVEVDSLVPVPEPVVAGLDLPLSSEPIAGLEPDDARDVAPEIPDTALVTAVSDAVASSENGFSEGMSEEKDVSVTAKSGSAIETAPWRALRGPEPIDPPEGVLVFEAEHWSEMNWAWEIREDSKSGGGAHIECKDERTNGGAQSHYTTFDFYNIRERHEISVLKYHFHAPRTGRYWLFGRMWPTDTHCSNSINVGVNRGGLHDRRDHKIYDGVFMGTRLPFRWRWARASGVFTLKAGDNYVHVFPHESGLMVDQFMLVPQEAIGRFSPNNEVYRANLEINRATDFEAQAGPPLHLSFDTPSKVISADHAPDIRLALRVLRPARGEARIRVALREAGSGRRDFEVADFSVTLEDLPPLALADLDFSRLDFETLPRREYLLTAELLRDGETLASGHRVLMHPFVWEVTDALPYLANSQSGPLDGDQVAKDDDETLAWRPLKAEAWDPLGIMDFGIQIAGGSLHAPAHRVVYARTEVDVPETGEYLLKVQSDDQTLLWIDGERVYRADTMRSVIRNSGKTRLRLEQGRRRIRMRVNHGRDVRKLQGSFWKASLRFRTKDDTLAHVTGAGPVLPE